MATNLPYADTYTALTAYTHDYDPNKQALKGRLGGQFTTLYDLYGRSRNIPAPEVEHYTGKGFSLTYPTIAMTGTAISGGVTEAQIIAGGETIILTLTNGTWAASGTVFNALRQGFLDGLTSSSSGTYSFRTAVAANCAVTDVVRTSSTVVTITLDAAAAYGIVADDTVTVTIPSGAVVYSNGYTAYGTFQPVTPTFTVTAATPTIAATGTIVTGGVLESEIVTGGQTLILTVTGAQVAASGATFNALRQGIINGLTGNHAEAHSWETDIKAASAVTTVVRTSATIITYTSPAAATYSITSTNEVVTIVIPNGVIVNTQSGEAYAGTFTTTPATFTITEGS